MLLSHEKKSPNVLPELSVELNPRGGNARRRARGRGLGRTEEEVGGADGGGVRTASRSRAAVFFAVTNGRP